LRVVAVDGIRVDDVGNSECKADGRQQTNHKAEQPMWTPWTTYNHALDPRVATGRPIRNLDFVRVRPLSTVEYTSVASVFHSRPGSD